MTTTKTLKADAVKAGLELYYDTQWQSWGLIDPQLRVESLWLSPGAIRHLSREEFATHYIAALVASIQEYDTMTIYTDRISDAAEEVSGTVTLMREAAYEAGFDDQVAVDAAIFWTSQQCDFDNDDYETLEATMLARLEDADKTGER